MAPSQNRVLDGGRLHFSSCVSTATRGHAVHLPPFIHFLKPFFAYNVGRRTNPPFLKGSLTDGSGIVHRTLSQLVLDLDDDIQKT
jgi:hypothetical protein